jgi:hypothetical protein
MVHPIFFPLQVLSLWFFVLPGPWHWEGHVTALDHGDVSRGSGHSEGKIDCKSVDQVLSSTDFHQASNGFVMILYRVPNTQ